MAMMEVILLSKIDNLGDLGDRVKVRPGYGRNYLIPQGKATAATPENIKIFEERRAELERQAAQALAEAQQRRDALAELRLRIPAKVGQEGRLFGSVGTDDIAEAAAAAGVPLEKREVRLPDGPLREVGEHTVALHLYSDVDASITVEVVPEEG